MPTTSISRIGQTRTDIARHATAIGRDDAASRAAAPVSLIWLDRQGVVLDGHVSDHHHTLLGRQPLVGRRLAEILPGAVGELAASASIQVLSGHGPATIQLDPADHDGQTCRGEARLVATEAGHCLLSLTTAPAAGPLDGDRSRPSQAALAGVDSDGPPDPDVDGRPAQRVAEISRQISETRAVRAEVRLRDAIESTSEGIAIWNHHERLVLCNRRYRDLYREHAHHIVPGVLFADLLRRLLRDGALVTPIGDDNAWIAARLRHRHSGVAEPVERQLADGRWVRIATQGTSDGGIVAVQSDITEIKRRETALLASEGRARRAEARLRDAIESTSEAIVLWDPDDRLVLCNRQFLVTYPELHGHVRPGVRFETLAWQLARSGRVAEAIGREAVWVAERREGRRRWPSARFERSLTDGRWVRITSRRTRDGGIVSNHTDITDLKCREVKLSEREAQLRGIIDNIPGAVFRRVRHPDGRIEFPYHSEGVAARYGLSADQIVAHPEVFVDAVHDDDRAIWRAAVEASAIDLSPFELNFRLVRRSGEVRWLRSMAQPRRSPDGSVVWDGISLDITELKRTEQALRESEERYRRLIDTAPVAILTHRHGRVGFANTRALQLFGARRPEDLLGRLAISLVHPDDRAVALARTQHLRAVGGTAEARELRAIRLDGRTVDIESAMVAITEGGELAIQTVMVDVTERNRARARVLHLAHHDVLTGLPNRALLFDRLRQALATARRNRQRVAVIMIDLDRFKEVNDSFGHPVGDRLLCAVGERLRGAVRASDTLARFGGDEFILIQSGLQDAAGARVVGEKIVAVLAEPFMIDGQEVHTGASVGVALYPDDGDEPDRLIKHADLALYRAKDSGRDRIAFFMHDMNQNVHLSRLMENDLRRALARDDLDMVLQPRVELASGRTVAVAAVLSWRHPRQGALAPAEFVPIAEASGLIRPLGAWLLGRACRAAATWRGAGRACRVAVSLSAVQWRHDHLTDHVRRALEGSGLPAELLELGVPEDLFQADHHASTNLRRIAALGVGLAIDDFGTRSSSLVQIQRMPVDTIKVAGSLVQAIGRDPGGERLVRAVVMLGSSLGKRIVAEGIETATQLALLTELGCGEGQGDLLGKAMPAQDFTPSTAARAAPAPGLRCATLDGRADLSTLEGPAVQGGVSWRSNGSTTTRSGSDPTS